jgi:hypothetical protein
LSVPGKPSEEAGREFSDRVDVLARHGIAPPRVQILDECGNDGVLG